MKKAKRRKYSDGLVGGARFRNNGVKKLMVLGVLPGAKEEPAVVENMFDKLALTPGSFQFCPDLKLANLTVGIGTHSSKHPSPFCDWEKNTEKPCTLRTFEGIRENFKNWKKNGSDKKTAMQYQNCIRSPSKIFPKIGVVIYFVALVQLHIMMGVCNKLYSELEKQFPEVCQWANKIHVLKEDYHKQFEGTYK